MPSLLAFVGLATYLLLSACAYQVIPTELESRVDRNLSFVQVKDSPVTYQGRLIVVGGEVLTVKHILNDGVRIEVLQLPLNNSLEPTLDRTASQGRFLAFQEALKDPATLPPGTLVTIVGEVLGSTVFPIDEVEYQYLTLRVRSLKAWERLDRRRFPSATFGLGMSGGF